jgi:hypothetical protein
MEANAINSIKKYFGILRIRIDLKEILNCNNINVVALLM